jgi:hypothetical protein
VERQTRRWAGVLAILFVALHLPFLPRSLEDLDSINFALGVRDFDVAAHQPHPPGYPLFILAAKASHLVVSSEARALAVVSVVAGVLAVFAIAAMCAGLDDLGRRPRLAPPATALAVAAPLFWVTASRPLSDVAGLAAALGVQAITLSAGPTGLIAASFLAGFAAGVRSQVIWLTVPLIAFSIATVRLRVDAADVSHVRLVARSIAAFAAGVVIWAIPLVTLTGGPSAYWRALSNQGTEDLTGVAMLWTNPTVRQLALALYNSFLAPWAAWQLGLVVLVLATAGFVRLARQRLLTLAALVAAFGPYFFFDVLFQETVTVRYALPLVVPMAFLAAWGADALHRRAAALLMGGLVAVSLWSGTTALYAYTRDEAPAFRLLADMSAARQELSPAPALAMHRKEDFDLRRPFVWFGDRGPGFETRLLPATAKHEWLQVVNYWNGGGRAPVWFVADPLRSDLALIAHGSPRAYRWQLKFPILLGGTRPSEMDWYVIDPPDWYLGEGWAVTPETAGIAKEDGRGPGIAPIQGWIRRQAGASTLMVGGRNLAGDPSPRVRVEVDGRQVDDTIVPPGFFLRLIDLPATAVPSSDYAAVSISASSADIAIEQFDAKPAGAVLFGYSDGWHEQEYNPATGRAWRWTSERASLHVRSDAQPLLLRLEGETETFQRDSRVIVRAGDRVLGEAMVGRSFSVSIRVPAEVFAGGDTTITIETDQIYVPAERRFRLRPSGDQRHLGLKIYACTITPAS